MEINTKKFYIIGIGCFLVIAVMSTANFFTIYENLNIYEKISSLANIFFNFALTGFFFYLYNQLKTSLPVETNNIYDDIKQFN